MPSKFSRNIKGGISSIANWSGGKPDDENEEPQAFGGKLRQDMEVAAARLPIQELDLDNLVDNPYQYLAQRTYDDDSMQELVDSIKNNGFYGALLARRKSGAITKYEVAYGHRRKEAASRAGLKTIPVKVIDLSDIEMARIMASENFSRLDLSPLGEAEVLGFLADRQNLSAKEISEFVGKKRGWVEKRLALYHAPPPLKKMVEQKPETFSHVPLLMRLKGMPEALESLITRTISQELTYQQLKETIDELTSPIKIEIRGKIVTDFTTSTLSGDSDRFHDNQDLAHMQPGGTDLALKVNKGRTAGTVEDHLAASVEQQTATVQPQATNKKRKAAELETELSQLEDLTGRLTNRNPATFSWSHRARIQKISQALKEIVGGD